MEDQKNTLLLFIWEKYSESKKRSKFTDFIDLFIIYKILIGQTRKKNRDYTTLYIDSGSNKNISAVYIGFVVILNKKNWDMCIFKKVTNEEEKKIWR